MSSLQKLVALGAFLFATLAATALACKVPVFRYALERWPADSYRVVAIVDGPPSDDESAAIAKLRSLHESKINLVVDVVDLSQLSEADLWSVEGLESNDQAPILQVFYPARDGQRKMCWTGGLTPANVEAWIDSPLRREIVDEVRSGTSAVWVIVEGADDRKNAELHSELTAALATATSEISIPDGVISREDAADHLRDDPSASMDDVLRCDIPLKISFSIERLKRDDPREMAMRAMIDGWTDSVEAPFVFPIFGRGRMIEPLSAAAFKESSVTAACRYMVGECSCSVKALNPGVDLILKNDWQETLGDQVVMIDAVDVSQPLEIPIPTGRNVQATDASPPVFIDREVEREVEREEESSGMFWVYAIMILGALAFWLKLRMGPA